MSKKDNLLKFWEYLESHQQTKDVIKSYKPQSQSLKIKSISHSDLICPRPSIVPSKAQLQGWRGVTGSKDTVINRGVDDDQDDISLAESEKTEVVSLPVIPRNEILPHTTKSRAKRNRTHPSRQKKRADQVPCVQVTTSIDVQMSPNPYQTPPAAANEFSNFKHSPTSAIFLDKSPLPDLDATSPKPATSLVKPSSAFSTFLSNPLKFTKAHDTKSTKKESPAVPKRNLIPSSPKVATEGSGIKPGCGQLIPGNLKSPFHENSRSKTLPKSPISSSKANFREQRSSSLKSVATSKTQITERRASLKVVASPYKSLQAAITPLKPETTNLQPITSPRIARLTASFQVATSSPASKTAAFRAINLEADTRTHQPGTSFSLDTQTLTSQLETGKAISTPSKIGRASASTSTCPSASPQVTACVQAAGSVGEQELLVKEGASGIVTSGTQNQDFSEFVNEIDKKVKYLESAITEEKLARIKLEREVAELKLTVTKLNLST